MLAGVATDCCVLSTALAAADAGCLVEVVADACAGSSDEAHERALEAVVEHLTPGQWDHARRPDRREAAATAVLALDLAEASVKVRQRPPGDPERLGVPVAADDEDAKALVARLVEQVGFTPVNGGTLADSEDQEPGTPVFGAVATADEVRTLARRTADSTAEIHQIIDTVQTGAVDAVRAIENGQTRSNEGVEQVTEAGSMLQRITQEVEAIRDMNRQIATAAEEQTSVAEDISRNITHITTVATANLDNVKRTEAASHNLRGLSGELNEVTARLGA